VRVGVRDEDQVGPFVVAARGRDPDPHRHDRDHQQRERRLAVRVFVDQRHPGRFY